MTQEKLQEALDAKQKVDALRKQIEEWKKNGIIFGGWSALTFKADNTVKDIVIAYYEGKLAELEAGFEAI